MKIVPFDQEYLKTILKYCPATGNWMWLNPSKYGSVKKYDNAGYITKRTKPFGVSGYYGICINKQKYYLHSLAFLYMTGSMPKSCVDHINGNGLDNRWINLRQATYAENSMNLSFKTKSSGLPFGVYVKRKKYSTKICVQKKVINLGVYDTPEEAYDVYVKARRKYFGDFNRL